MKKFAMDRTGRSVKRYNGTNDTPRHDLEVIRLMQDQSDEYPTPRQGHSITEEIPPTGAPIVPVSPGGAAEQANRELNAFVPLESVASKKKRTKTRNVIIGIVVVVLVLVGIGGFALWQTWQSALASVPPKTVTVEKALFTNDVEGKGSLEPVNAVTVSPEIDGIVESLAVSEGSAVNEGDVLFTIKNDDLASGVTQAASQLESARTALAQAENALSAAYTARNQAQEVAARQSAAAAQVASSNEQGAVATQSESTASYDTEIANAELGVQSARSALAAAQDTYDGAVARADKRTVRASMSGIVLVCNLTQGVALSSLSTSGTVPLQIADTSKMIVKVPISEIDIAKMEVGQGAQVSFDALPDTTCAATVTHIANSASSSADVQGAVMGSSSNSVRYEVTLLIDEPDPRLKSGMTAQAQITTETIEDALVVSSFAVVEEDDSAYVIKLNENDEGERVEVGIISSNDTLTVIEGSVKEGDRLVVQSSGTMGAATGVNVGLTTTG